MTSPATRPAAHVLDAEQTAYFDRNVGWLLRAATTRCRDRHLAEDLVQETFLRLFCVWGERREAILKNRAYATSALASAHTDHLRRRRARPPEELLRETDVEALLARPDAPEAGDQDPEVRDAVADLPSRQREVVYHHYYEGLSLAETADVMRIGANVVHNYHAKARKKLASNLSHLRTHKEATP